ncbi:hypothetical protein HPB47_006882, partial [Ixodes persulcatus]
RVTAEEEVFLRRALPGGSPAMAPAICDPSTSDAPGAGSTGCLLLYKTCVSRNVNCAWLLPITPRLGGSGALQAVQNLIVASTPYNAYADDISDVASPQLNDVTYEISEYVKPFPGIVRGVIHGLDPGTTTEQLRNIIVSPGFKIQQARMPGKSSSAVVTFEGPHVPFYIHAHGLYTRCRPYRHSIRCCSLCGDIGRRRDICPNQEVTVCERCHVRNPAPEHTYTPKCKLRGLDHLTASKDCPSSQGLLQAHLFRPAIVPPAIRGFPGPGGAVKNGTFGNLLPSFNATETSPKTSPDVFRTDAHLSKAAQNVSQRVRDVNGTSVCVRVGSCAPEGERGLA